MHITTFRVNEVQYWPTYYQYRCEAILIVFIII